MPGDQLSPMLFLVLMEVLNTLVRKEDAWSLLRQLGLRSISYRTSLYTDGMVMFISLNCRGF
jgi:hypothetical protein